MAKYQDPQTGLFNLRARQYDPGTGRFLTTDPIAPLIADPYVAAYVYANNQPTTLADPSGLSATGCSSFIREDLCRLVGKAARAGTDIAAGIIVATIEDTAAQIQNTRDCALRVYNGEMLVGGRRRPV